MISIELRYFAQLREQAGIGSERISTEATSPAGLYAELRERHGFVLTEAALKVAVNSAFSSWDRTLHDGDVVVFIPPVNGG